MSSTAPSLPKFVVWAPDYTDDGALQRRLAVRPSHLKNIQTLIRQGSLRKLSREICRLTSSTGMEQGLGELS